MNDNTWSVYKHTSPSEKVYIGISKYSPIKRWRGGKGYSNNKYFTNAINKYGWNNFKHEILYTDLSKEDACELEIALIAEYDATNPECGYNLSTGGEYGHAGRKQSEEFKLLMSKLHKGSHRTAEQREYLSKVLTGRTLSDEHKKHISEGLIGHEVSEETRKKISVSNTGKYRPPLSEETKQKIIESRVGYRHSEETKRKIGESNRHSKKPMSEETKQKISKSMQGRKISEETRQRMSASQKGRVSPNKGKLMSDEQKKKISDARKGFVMSQEQKEKISLANLGKVTSEETREKLSKAIRNRYYVNNGHENKRVFDDELDFYLNHGYVRGIVHTKQYKQKNNLEEVF